MPHQSPASSDQPGTVARLTKNESVTHQTTPQEYTKALKVLDINPEVLTTLDEILRLYRRKALDVKDNPLKLQQLNIAKDLLVELYQNQPESSTIKPAQLIEQIPLMNATRQLILIESNIAILPEPAANKEVVEALSTIQTQMEDAVQKPTPLQKPRIEQIRKSLIDVTEKIKSEGLNNLSSKQAQAYKNLLDQETTAFNDIAQQFQDDGLILPSDLSREESFFGDDGEPDDDEVILPPQTFDTFERSLSELSKSPDDQPLQEAVTTKIDLDIAATQKKLQEIEDKLIQAAVYDQPAEHQALLEQEKAENKALLDSFYQLKNEIEEKEYNQAKKRTEDASKYLEEFYAEEARIKAEEEASKYQLPPGIPDAESKPIIKPQRTEEQQTQIDHIDRMLKQLPEISAARYPKIAELRSNLNTELTTIQDHIQNGIPIIHAGFANLKFMTDFLHQVTTYFDRDTTRSNTLKAVNEHLGKITIEQFVKDLAENQELKKTAKVTTITSMQSKLNFFKITLLDLQRSYVKQEIAAIKHFNSSGNNAYSLAIQDIYKKNSRTIPNEIDNFLQDYQKATSKNSAPKILTSQEMEALHRVRLYLTNLERPEGVSSQEFINQVNSQIQEISENS